MSDRIKEMIRRAALEDGGLGVSTGTSPDASPVKAPWPKGSFPTRARGKTDQPEQDDRCRVVGWIPLPQSAVKGRLTNRRPWSSDSATESGPRPTARKSA